MTDPPPTLPAMQPVVVPEIPNKAAFVNPGPSATVGTTRPLLPSSFQAMLARASKKAGPNKRTVQTTLKFAKEAPKDRQDGSSIGELIAMKQDDDDDDLVLAQPITKPKPKPRPIYVEPDSTPPKDNTRKEKRKRSRSGKGDNDSSREEEHPKKKKKSKKMSAKSPQMINTEVDISGSTADEHMAPRVPTKGKGKVTNPQATVSVTSDEEIELNEKPAKKRTKSKATKKISKKADDDDAGDHGEHSEGEEKQGNKVQHSKNYFRFFKTQGPLEDAQVTIAKLHSFRLLVTKKYWWLTRDQRVEYRAEIWAATEATWRARHRKNDQDAPIPARMSLYLGCRNG